MTFVWGRSSKGPSCSTTKPEGAWRHWHQILFEYGHIFGADLAEKYPAKSAMYLGLTGFHLESIATSSLILSPWLLLYLAVDASAGCRFT